MVEVKSIIAKRRPPGDRWSFVFPDTDTKFEDEIYDTLTNMLQAIFDRTGHTKFHIDSKEGTISTSVWEKEPEPEPEPEKKWSLYGEE